MSMGTRVLAHVLGNERVCANQNARVQFVQTMMCTAAEYCLVCIYTHALNMRFMSCTCRLFCVYFQIHVKSCSSLTCV